MRERGRYREEGEGGWSKIFGEWKVGGVRERERVMDGWQGCHVLS